MKQTIDELVETLAQDARPVRRAPHPFALALLWLAGAAVYVALALAVSGVRPDVVAKLAEPWFAAEVAALAALLIASSVGAAVFVFPDLHQMRWAAPLPVLLLVAFAAVVFCSWSDNPSAPLPVHNYQCTLSIALLALLPAAWMFYFMRKFASTHYRIAGSVALLYAFSIGALWLRLQEPNDSVMHVIQWHYLPMVGVCIAGLWLGKVVLRW